MPAPPTLSSLPTLAAGELTLRAAVAADADRFLVMLHEEGVAEWWGDNDLASITAELTGHYAIEVDGHLAGLLECHQEVEPMYPSVAFDIFLGTRFHGHGYGRTALRLAVDHFIELGHHRFTIDPAVDNGTAIRSYSAVGFQRVGVLRDAERAPSGEWRDSVLMDLLASDLTDPPA
jgi:aminoglycoside 6'-N-acetyltransferase